MSIEPELVQAIGREKTIAIEQAFGGQRKYFAAKVRPDDRMVQVIGLDAARIVAREFAGLRSYIPITLAKIERNRAIRQAVLSGFSKAEVAGRFGLSERTIRMICEGLTQPLWGTRARNQRITAQGRVYERHGRTADSGRA